MTNSYAGPVGTATMLLLALLASPARAQAPTLIGLTPAANARAVPRNASVVATFSQPLTAASAGALRVFSAQRGGLRGGGVATLSGNTLTFAPTAYGFRPGETVQYAVTTAAAGAGGSLARARVGQFTAAVGSGGAGSFQTGSDPTVSGPGTGIAVGDVDGDGDLDLLAPGYGSVSVRLNDGAGHFGPGQRIALSNSCLGIAVGDVDGDGDLDLLAAITGTATVAGTTVSVYLNNGTGTFASGQDVTVGRYPHSVALGDLDGDGDLDFVTADAGDGNTPGTTASVRLNNGSGVFGGTQAVTVGSGPATVVLGDVDGDGDLDLATANEFGSSVSVRLNDGSGSFGGTQNVGTVANSVSVTLADVDGDGDLDLLATNATFAGTVSVRLNNGSGSFGGTQEVAVGSFPFSLAVGDVDGDGDLDLLADNYYATPSTVSVRLNNGAGTFGGTQDVAVGSYSRGLTLGDVDNDGDLDLLASSELDPIVSVRLNQSIALATTAPRAAAPLTAYPNPATGRVTLTLPPTATSAELLDPLGRVVRVVAASAGAAVLDVAGLAPGLYVVRAAGQVVRLVVE